MSISHPCLCCGALTKNQTLCFNCEQAEESAPTTEQIAAGCAEVQQWPGWKNRQRLANKQRGAIEIPYVKTSSLATIRDEVDN